MNISDLMPMATEATLMRSTQVKFVGNLTTGIVMVLNGSSDAAIGDTLVVGETKYVVDHVEKMLDGLAQKLKVRPATGKVQ